MVCQFIFPVYFTIDGPCDLFIAEYLVVDDLIIWCGGLNKYILHVHEFGMANNPVVQQWDEILYGV